MGRPRKPIPSHKTCSVCGVEKPYNAENFRYRKRAVSEMNPTGASGSTCRQCLKDQDRVWKQANREEMHRKNRERYWNNREEHLKYRKEQRKQEKYRKYARDYWQKRRQSDPDFRVRQNISRSIRYYLTLQDASKDNLGTFEHLPYTPEQLKEHLEAQFDEHMTWDNYGDYWHIDHIYPQSLLPYDSLEHENFIKCWSLDNLQPLEAIENIRKSNNIVEADE